MHSSISLLLATLVSTVYAHTVITYPGWRGDNLHANGTVNTDDYTTGYFPYGMQWMYPCGGMKVTTNRTYWPVTGGGIAFEPGWFQGHSTGLIYINLGLGTIPPNYSHPINPVFGIVGPRNTPYPGLGICLPQLGMPANLTVQPGDNATLQVVLAAKHGAALYSCVDITFTDNMSLVTPITPQNCYNDSQIGFNMVIATASLTNIASALSSPSIWSLSSLVVGITAIISAFFL